MCGIIGIYNFDKRKKVDKTYLEKGSDLLAHRGPDDQGIFIDDNIGMGFRRLSIIDLSKNGHQPMTNEDESLWLVCNGEIYNYLELKKELGLKGHKFRSSSDAEVILHSYEEYGEDCVDKFNGMWAFVIWDRKEKKLFCSRDRFGIKPFYYFSDKDRFIWSSEIKAILVFDGVERKENFKKTYEYIAYRYLDNSEETMFQNIYQLRPAHSIVIKNGKITTYRYWDLEDKKNDYDLLLKDDKKIAEKFRELLFDAVKLHMRSDVEVRTLLSGGLDSSSIACIQKDMRLRGTIDSMVRSITIVHDEKKINEYEFVREIIDYENITNKVVRCGEDDFVDALERVVYIQDEPFPQMTPFNHYFLIRAIAKEKVKVVLSGEGSDECLAGYLPMLSSYYFTDLLRSLQVNKFFREMVYFLSRTNTDFHPFSILLMQVIKAFFPRRFASLFKAKYLEKSLGFISDDFKNLERETLHFSERKVNFSSLNNNLYRMLVCDSLPQILHMEDRNSMAFSIEQRVPLLDYRLVEFSFSLSNMQKINNGMSKVILRNSLKGILPEKIRMRTTKLSFNAPEGEWLRSKRLINYLNDINFSDFLETGIVNKDKFLKEFSEFREGSRPYRFVLWRIINYIIWKKVYHIL